MAVDFLDKLLTTGVNVWNESNQTKIQLARYDAEKEKARAEADKARMEYERQLQEQQNSWQYKVNQFLKPDYLVPAGIVIGSLIALKYLD